MSTITKPPAKSISNWDGATELAKNGPFSVGQIAAAWNIPCPKDQELIELLQLGKFETPDELFKAHEAATGPVAKNQIVAKYCEMVLAEEAANM